MITWYSENEAYIGNRNSSYYHILYTPYRGRIHIFWHTYPNQDKDLVVIINKYIECTKINSLIFYIIDSVYYMDKYNEISLAGI